MSTYLMTTSPASNACLHPGSGCEHSAAIQEAVERGEIITQEIDAAALAQLQAGGTFVDQQAACLLSEE